LRAVQSALVSFHELTAAWDARKARAPIPSATEVIEDGAGSAIDEALYILQANTCHAVLP
jgi:hypothetical protein